MSAAGILETTEADVWAFLHAAAKNLADEMGGRAVITFTVSHDMAQARIGTDVYAHGKGKVGCGKLLGEAITDLRRRCLPPEEERKSKVAELRRCAARLINEADELEKL